MEKQEPQLYRHGSLDLGSWSSFPARPWRPAEHTGHSSNHGFLFGSGSATRTRAYLYARRFVSRLYGGAVAQLLAEPLWRAGRHGWAAPDSGGLVLRGDWHHAARLRLLSSALG